MQPPPVRPVKEFGRRDVRPAARPGAREPMPSRPVRTVTGLVGQNTRDFLRPGATAYLGKAGPDARRRAAAVLAVTGGLLYGAAIAPHAAAGANDVRNLVVAGADLSRTVAMPFVDRIAAVEASKSGATVAASMPTPADAAQALRSVGQAAEGAVDAVGSAAKTAARVPGQIAGQVADAVSAAASDLWSGTRHAADEAGAAVRTAAYDFAASRAAEMRQSAGLIAEGLAPLIAQVAEAAVEARAMLVEDLERQAKLAEIEKTGVVVDIPGHRSYVEADDQAEQVRSTMAALVDGIERRIAAGTPEAVKVSMEQPKVAWATPKSVTPGRVQIASRGRPHEAGRAGGRTESADAAGSDSAMPLTQRASYRVDGDMVHIGGSVVKASTVASIAHAARITNNDPVYLASLAGRESNFKTHDNAKTSSAAGPFQFIVDTWFRAIKDFGAKLGLGSVADEIKPTRRGYTVADPARKKTILAMREDPLMSGLVVSEMEKSDRQVLEKALGRRATAGERYMPHFLGIGDAVRMVSLARTNPSAPAADHFRKAAGANRSLFYAKNGAKYSVAQVIGGFKNWFEGPNGGMARYAAFAQAAAPPASGRAAHSARAPSRHAAPVRTAASGFVPDASTFGGQADPNAKPVMAVDAGRGNAASRAPTRLAAAGRSHEPAVHVARAAETAGKVARAGGRAQSHEVATGPRSNGDRPGQAASATAADQIAAEPAVAAPRAGGGEPQTGEQQFETKWVKTPVVPGKPATFNAGGRIGGYVDAKGLLRGYATTLARSKIIEGFGDGFARLPRELQEHLQNAAQFDLNFIAQYAHRWMPKAMRDGFAENGLTFVAAVPQTGGKLVAVRVPKPREAVAATAPHEPAPASVAAAFSGPAAAPATPPAPAPVAEASAFEDDAAAFARAAASDPEGVAVRLAVASGDELEALKAQRPDRRVQDVFAGMQNRPIVPPIPSGLDRDIPAPAPMQVVQIDWTPWDMPQHPAKDRHRQGMARSDEEVRRQSALLTGIRIERKQPSAPIRHHLPDESAHEAPGLRGP